MCGNAKFPLEGTQPIHERIGAAGGETRGEDGPHQVKIAALLQPAAGLGKGLLRGLPQGVRTVPVHVHLAHQAGQPGLLQQLHQYQRGRAVNGGENTGPGGGAVFQLLRKDLIGPAGIVLVGKMALLREGVVLQPLQQLHVHAQAPVGVLAGVDVKVHKAGQDELLPKILHGKAPVALRQAVKDSGHHAVLTHQIAPRPQLQLSAGGGVDHVALQGKASFHDSLPGHTQDPTPCSGAGSLTFLGQAGSSAKLPV